MNADKVNEKVHVLSPTEWVHEQIKDINDEHIKVQEECFKLDIAPIYKSKDYK